MGFEHSVVNMFLFPSGIILGGGFTWGDYLLWNEIPTIIGNIVGGLTFVGAIIYATHYKITTHGPDAPAVKAAEVSAK
jgi:formate/nitrite transporter FocA (FNT family)